MNTHIDLPPCGHWPFKDANRNATLFQATGVFSFLAALPLLVGAIMANIKNDSASARHRFWMTTLYTALSAVNAGILNGTTLLLNSKCLDPPQAYKELAIVYTFLADLSVGFCLIWWAAFSLRSVTGKVRNAQMVRKERKVEEDDVGLIATAQQVGRALPSIFTDALHHAAMKQPESRC